MQKSVRIFVFLVLGFALLFPNLAAADSPDQEWGQALLHRQLDPSTDDSQGSGEDVVFTEKQKRKLAKMHDRLYKDHVKLIELYADYGAMTEEQKQRKLSILEKHHQWLEENDYKWCAHHKRHDGGREHPKMQQPMEKQESDMDEAQ